MQTLGNVLDRLNEWKNRFRGSRAFVIGNGPSLTKMDLSQMIENNDVSFALNNIHLIYPYTTWRPTFFVCVNEIYNLSPPHQFEANIMRHLEMNIPTFVNAGFLDPAVSCRADFWQNQISNPNLYFVRCWGGRDAPFSERHWSWNIRETATKPGSCLVALIQIAAWMGFDPLYLIGCDLGYRNTGNKKDCNHFSKNYGMIEKNFDEENHNAIMNSSHELIKKTFDKEGRMIYNASIGGELEVYPRVSYSSLF